MHNRFRERTDEQCNIHYNIIQAVRNDIVFSDGASTDTVINPLDELCAHSEYVDPSAMYILNGTERSVTFYCTNNNSSS